MKIGRVFKLLSFLNKIISFFSLIHRHQKLVLLFPKSACDIKHAYVLVLFFALSLFVVAIFLRGSSKESSESEESHSHSVTSLAIVELYPLSYEVEDKILDETYGLTNIVAKYDQDLLDETYCLAKVEDGDQEFVPRLVQLELIEGATGSHDDYNDFIPRIIDVKLIKGVIQSDDESEESHGFEGYDEDNDDEGDDDDANSTSSDGNDDDELKTRVEEFIAKNISKWKEEMLNDKFLYLEY